MADTDVVFCVRLANVLSFAVFFGVSVWVGLISGPVMFKTLPRHNFGLVQSKLFPVAFWLCSFLLTVCLATFMYEHPWGTWEGRILYQVSSLIISLALLLLNALYLGPNTTRAMFAKHKFEKEVGAGKVPGSVDKGKDKALCKDPKYQALKKRIGILHGSGALTYLAALFISMVHLWGLAANLKTI